MADVGMYLQTVMLLLRAEGLHRSPQMDVVGVSQDRRGKTLGHALDDWLAAEREILESMPPSISRAPKHKMDY